MENDLSSFFMSKFDIQTASPNGIKEINVTETPADTPKTLGAQPPAKTAAPVPVKPLYPDEPWMADSFNKSMIYHESRNDPNARGDYKYDKAGNKIPGTDKAAGLYQIHDNYGKNAQLILEKWNRANSGDPETDKRYKQYSERFKDFKNYKYSPDDRFNPSKAEMMYRVVMQELTNQFKAKHHREPTNLEMASLHHLGTIDIAGDYKYQSAWSRSDTERTEKEKAEKTKQKK